MEDVTPLWLCSATQPLRDTGWVSGRAADTSWWHSIPFDACLLTHRENLPPCLLAERNIRRDATNLRANLLFLFPRLAQFQLTAASLTKATCCIHSPSHHQRHRAASANSTEILKCHPATTERKCSRLCRRLASPGIHRTQFQLCQH